MRPSGCIWPHLEATWTYLRASGRIWKHPWHVGASGSIHKHVGTSGSVHKHLEAGQKMTMNFGASGSIWERLGESESICLHLNSVLGACQRLQPFLQHRKIKVIVLEWVQIHPRYVHGRKFDNRTSARVQIHKTYKRAHIRTHKLARMAPTQMIAFS